MTTVPECTVLYSLAYSRIVTIQPSGCLQHKQNVHFTHIITSSSVPQHYKYNAKKLKTVYRSLWKTHCRGTECHLPYGITQQVS